MLQCSLEAPHRGVSNAYSQRMFSWRNKKNLMWIPLLFGAMLSTSIFISLAKTTSFQWSVIYSIYSYLFALDDFNFLIVNFPFLSSNIPSAPAYGVYVSQLIRYARTCSNYQDFMERGKVLTQKLLSQGYQKTKLVATLKKFYGRHHDLVNPYNVAVSRIVSDVFASDAP